MAIPFSGRQRSIVASFGCLFFLLLALCAIGYAQGDPGVTSSEIVIGSCAALDGPSRGLGTQTVSGAFSYINLINSQGGVGKRAGNSLRTQSSRWAESAAQEPMTI